MHAGDLLTRRALLTPQREALCELATGQRYSYAELNRRANRVANFMAQDLGVKKGDPVSILAHNSVAYIDLLYGVAKIGAIMAPLNWRLGGDELAYIINDCKPKALLVGPEFSGLIRELRDRVQVGHYLGLEGADLGSEASYEALLAMAPDAEPKRPLLDGEDPYCILYTSGTTGAPKGAVIPHRQVLWNCINTAASWGLTESDVSPVFTPLFHAGGLFAFLTPLFYLGGRIVLSRTFDAEQTLQAITRERCTVILGVPTLYQMWMTTELFTQSDFSDVRWFISGGAPCPESLMEAWRDTKGVVFRQGYGLTEVGPNCFTMTDEESRTKSGSVGKPIFHSEMRIIDTEGRAVNTGEVGELVIQGPHVCTGYWGNPQASAEVLDQGWFHTGDMARMDEDGFYYLVGRYKDMLISGGENIYAAEVEAVFREHPAVSEAALIGAPHPELGEVGLMVVVLQSGAPVGEQDLLEFCKGRLARYKVPKRVVFTEALPYSSYGKVQKSELRRKYLGT